MTDTAPGQAWLERSDGERVPLQGSCSIGRSPTCVVVLPDERVSRRHAMIHVQERDEYWLVDLGSSNGTYLNGRRVHQPTRLRDQDQLEIGQFRLSFHQRDAATDAEEDDAVRDKTIHDFRSATCWLLVADIEGSTTLIQTHTAEELSTVTGKWLAECKEIVEECGGSINKFLGDGFFAYWHDRERAGSNVLRAVQSLRRLQAQAQPRFRVVLHRGQVFMGGGASLGEESLMGKEVNFVFRMERLASTIGESCLVSEPASADLEPGLSVREAGRHPLPGFTGEFLFFAV